MRQSSSKEGTAVTPLKISRNLQHQLTHGYPKVAIWTIFSVTAIASLAMLTPFAPALLWGVVLAILFAPITNRIAKGGNRGIAAGLTLVLIVLLIAVPIVVIVGVLGVQANSAVRELDVTGTNEAIARIQQAIAPTLERFGMAKFDLQTWFDANKESLLQALRKPAGSAATYLGSLLLNLVVALFAAYYFLRDAVSWQPAALKLMALPEDVGKAILTRVADTARSVFIGTIAVAAVQGILVGITLAIIKGPAPLLLGLATFGISLIPILGAPLVYLPVAGFMLLENNTVGAVILLLVGFILVSQVDNILRPLIVGRSVALHPLAVFVFILGGAAIIGPVGLLAGPMILSILVGCRDLVLAHLERANPDEQQIAEELKDPNAEIGDDIGRGGDSAPGLAPA